MVLEKTWRTWIKKEKLQSSMRHFWSLQLKDDEASTIIIAKNARIIVNSHSKSF